MLKQTESSAMPEHILQRLDKIAAELQLLREAILTFQEQRQETTGAGGVAADTERDKSLPDLQSFRASLTVQGDSLRDLLLRERGEHRF